MVDGNYLYYVLLLVLKEGNNESKADTQKCFFRVNDVLIAAVRYGAVALSLWLPYSIPLFCRCSYLPFRRVSSNLFSELNQI